MKPMKGKYQCPKCNSELSGEEVDGYVVCAQCGTRLEYIKELKDTKETLYYRCDVCQEVLETKSLSMGWRTCPKCGKGTLRPVHVPNF